MKIQKTSWKIGIEWKPEDLWVGVFWRSMKPYYPDGYAKVDIWICLLPCLPIHIVRQKWLETVPSTEGDIDGIEE